MSDNTEPLTFENFENYQSEFSKIAHEIDRHNILQSRKELENFTYKELIPFCKKYPDALIVIQIPIRNTLTKMNDKLKYYFSLESHITIQPMIPYKGVVANDQVIALYVESKPDLNNFNIDELRIFKDYKKGKDILNHYEKTKEDIIFPSFELDAEIYAYWIDDYYFEKYNWKSLHNDNSQYVSVFNTYRGNRSSEVIFDSHY